MITRRAALLGAGATLLAACSRVPDDVPDVDDGPLVSGRFASSYRRTDVGWSVAYPPGSSSKDRLPVLVALHGRGGDHDAAFGGGLNLDRFLADAVHHGVAPFAIAAADGGDHEYWHPRQGTDPTGMIVHEFLPLLAARGLDVRRIGLLGWSMGGYGTLYLGEVLGRARVAVAVAESPAIWHTGAQTVQGAFDDGADFDKHTVFGRLHRLDGIAMRLDCGDTDGFAPITRDVRRLLHPTPAGGIASGAHDVHFWRGQAPAQLQFVAASLHAR